MASLRRPWDRLLSCSNSRQDRSFETNATPQCSPSTPPQPGVKVTATGEHTHTHTHTWTGGQARTHTRGARHDLHYKHGTYPAIRIRRHPRATETSATTCPLSYFETARRCPPLNHLLTLRVSLSPPWMISFVWLALFRPEDRQLRGALLRARHTSQYHRKTQYYDGLSVSRRLPATITTNEWTSYQLVTNGWFFVFLPFTCVFLPNILVIMLLKYACVCGYVSLGAEVTTKGVHEAGTRLFI